MTKTAKLSKQDNYQLIVMKLINKSRKIQNLMNQCENFLETLETLYVDGGKLDEKYSLLKKELERVRVSADILGTRSLLLYAVENDSDYFSSSVPSDLEGFDQKIQGWVSLD